VHCPWRKVKVTERRAAEDYAQCLRDLVDIHYPDAESRIIYRPIRPAPCIRRFRPSKPGGSCDGSNSTIAANGVKVSADTRLVVRCSSDIANNPKKGRRRLEIGDGYSETRRAAVVLAASASQSGKGREPDDCVFCGDDRAAGSAVRIDRYDERPAVTITTEPESPVVVGSNSAGSFFYGCQTPAPADPTPMTATRDKCGACYQIASEICLRCCRSSLDLSQVSDVASLLVRCGRIYSYLPAP
jgi:hypothetical protein